MPPFSAQPVPLLAPRGATMSLMAIHDDIKAGRPISARPGHDQERLARNNDAAVVELLGERHLELRRDHVAGLDHLLLQARNRHAFDFLPDEFGDRWVADRLAHNLDPYVVPSCI